jgi:hypothetical protein
VDRERAGSPESPVIATSVVPTGPAEPCSHLRVPVRVHEQMQDERLSHVSLTGGPAATICSQPYDHL